MEKKSRELTGTVVSSKNNKTITVLVETYKMKQIKQKLEMLYVLLKHVQFQKQSISI